MSAILSALAETAFLIGVVLFAQLIVLMFRNPHRSAVLRSEPVAIFASLCLVILFGLAVAVEVYGLNKAGLGPIAAVVLSIVIFAATAWVNYAVFGLKDRLRRADSGESPFRSSRGTVPPSATAPGV